MSVLASVVFVWAIGFCVTLVFFLYTNGSDDALSEDEKVGWGGNLFFSVIWPLLLTLWIVTACLSGIRRFHTWLSAS